MSHIQIAKAPPPIAVIPYYATAAQAFVLLCVLMLFSAESFTGHYFNPRLLTCVHLAALGWGTMIIFGATHQLLPVICEEDLYSSKLAAASWFFLTGGIALLAWSFWDFTTGFTMTLGGSLIVIAALLFFFNVLATGKYCSNYSVQKAWICTSAFWLLVTTSLGLLLAINLYHPFIPGDHLEVLKLHAHAGFAGWFLQLISGVSTKLVPMFLLGKSSREKLLKWAFAFQNIALAGFLIDAWFFGSSWRWYFWAAIAAAGIFLWLFYLLDAFKNRVRKKLDFQMKHTMASFAFLIAALLLLPFVIAFTQPHIAILYGTLIFMGWITGIILGKTFKTLPFIIWNEHYKNLSGKMKVPLPKHLFNEPLVTWQFGCFIAAIILLCAGIISGWLPLIRFALGMWLIVSLIYLYNVLKILLHKTQHQPVSKT